MDLTDIPASADPVQTVRLIEEARRQRPVTPVPLDLSCLRDAIARR
jgi:hypothetical protein